MQGLLLKNVPFQVRRAKLFGTRGRRLGMHGGTSITSNHNACKLLCLPRGLGHLEGAMEECSAPGEWRRRFAIHCGRRVSKKDNGGPAGFVATFNAEQGIWHDSRH